MGVLSFWNGATMLVTFKDLDFCLNSAIYMTPITKEKIHSFHRF